MAIDFETIFAVAGLLACLLASLYLLYKGNRLAGLLLTLGFVGELQALLYMTFGYPESMAACAAKDFGSYYDCLPLMYKVSIHAGQAARFLLAAGIVLMALPKYQKKAV